MTSTPTVDGARFMAEQRLRWNEKSFQAAVLDRAREYGWTAYHTFFSDRSRAGWPDLVLWRERIIFAELKSMKGNLRVGQQETLDELAKAGGECYLWRPCCWNSDEIEQVLKP